MQSHTAIVGRLAAALPTGRTLPDDVWRRRHRALLTVLWLHVVGLTLFAWLRGYDLIHALEHGAPLVVLAGMAMAAKSNRRAAAAFVSLGLITSSALLVHIWDGVIEGHFHFFVMIALLTLYEDWFPFLVAAAYVVLHHGLMGALDPGGVYNHPDAVAHPWKWALIHGGFVVAAGTASVVTWRLNENVRAETQSAYRRARESEERFKSAFSDAPIGMVLATIESAAPAGSCRSTARCASSPDTPRSSSSASTSATSRIPTTSTRASHTSSAAGRRALELRAQQSATYMRRAIRSGRRCTCRSCTTATDEPAYTIAQVQDITERKRAEESIRESSRQLAEAQKLAQLGSWQWSPGER